MSVAECRERLGANVFTPFDYRVPSAPLSGEPIVGSLGDRRVRLFRRGGPPPRIVLDLQAELRSADHGTLIIGSTGPSALTLSWFSSFCLAAVVAMVFVVVRRETSDVAFLALMIATVAYWLFFGLPGADSLAERTALLGKLQRWLEAEPLTKESPPLG